MIFVVDNKNRKRALSALALSALPCAELAGARVDSTVRGVKLGLITGSLNPLAIPGEDPIDIIIEQCLQLGAANVELVNVMMLNEPQVVNGGRFGQPPEKITPEYLIRDQPRHRPLHSRQ